MFASLDNKQPVNLTNNIQIGYCDGEDRFQSVNDNVTF